MSALQMRETREAPLQACQFLRRNAPAEGPGGASRGFAHGFFRGKPALEREARQRAGATESDGVAGRGAWVELRWPVVEPLSHVVRLAADGAPFWCHGPREAHSPGPTLQPDMAPPQGQLHSRGSPSASCASPSLQCHPTPSHQCAPIRLTGPSGVQKACPLPGRPPGIPACRGMSTPTVWRLLCGRLIPGGQHQAGCGGATAGLSSKPHVHRTITSRQQALHRDLRLPSDHL